MQRAFRSIAQEARPIELNLEVSRLRDRVTIRGSVTGDEAKLVRRVRLVAKQDGKWRRSLTGVLTVDLSESQRLDFYAEALGPGDAIVASEGNQESPLFRLFHSDEKESGGDDTALWVGIVSGATALAVAAVITAVLVTDGGSKSNEFMPPVVTF